MDASRQIPDGLEDEEKIFGYDRSEIIVVIIALFIGMISSELLPPGFESVSIFIPIVSIIIGIFIVFVTPNHLKPTDWLGSMKHFLFRPTKVQHISIEDGMAREQKDVLEESKVYELGERTQELSWVDKIHKNSDAVERIDGVVVGGIKVHPPNMSLASGEKWERMINNWQSYVDNSVEYPVQIYVTSSDFPVEDYIEHYRNRLNDPDLQERPILQELLRDFLSWYPEYLQYRGTKQKEFYLIYTVDEDEVIGSEMEEQSITEQLTEVPVLGEKVESFVSSDEDDEDKVKAKMLAELNRRIRAGRDQGVRSLPGAKSRQLSGFELAVLLREYWTGRSVEMEDEAVLNETGLTARSGEPVDPEETRVDTAGGADDIL